MVNDMYLIESETTVPLISLEGFVPRRKVALLFQGAGKSHGASFDMAVDLLVQRGYDYITAIRNSSAGPFCSDVVPFFYWNVEGKINELAETMTSDDILFTAIFGVSSQERGAVYLPDQLGNKIYGYQLRDSFRVIPAHHIVHYASPDAHAGDLARILSQASHPELGTRHLGIAPTLPTTSGSLFPYKKDPSSPELVHPFHAGFFDLAAQPTLLARFQAAAQYHREHVDQLRYGVTSAYMRYASIRPEHVTFTR